jgi:hypothetical protein
MLDDSKVKRIVAKDSKGNVLLSIPVTWGADGTAALVFFSTLACSVRGYSWNRIEMYSRSGKDY